MTYFETFLTESRLGTALLLAGSAVAVCWRWPRAPGKWWLIAAAVVAVWQLLTGAGLIPIHGRNPNSTQTVPWPVGGYWLLASLLIIYAQTVCLPGWNSRPARRWFTNVLGSWGAYCLLTVGRSSSDGSDALIDVTGKFSAGLMGLGLIFGFGQEWFAGDRKDGWLTAAKNVGLALLVGWLALFVLAVVSSGYAVTNPVIFLGILGGSVAVGLGVTPPSSQDETQREPSDVQPTVTAAAHATPTPAPSGKEAVVEVASAASQTPPPPAETREPSQTDTGASPALSATTDVQRTDASAPPEAANQRFSFGAFVAACFVMVPVTWVAVALAAPLRGPLSPHFTTLGTRQYLQDQGPVNCILSLSIALIALVIAKVAWRPGWRSFAAGILFSGLLLALLALGLHK